jgi:hypothetical protein
MTRVEEVHHDLRRLLDSGMPGWNDDAGFCTASQGGAQSIFQAIFKHCSGADARRSSASAGAGSPIRSRWIGALKHRIQLAMNFLLQNVLERDQQKAEPRGDPHRARLQLDAAAPERSKCSASSCQW